MTQTSLPILEEVSISNYSLFNRDLGWTFHPGINLFLGINGIGKTTTIRAISFAIVGREAVSRSNYFSSRMPELGSREPIVRICFRVRHARFRVMRRLDTLQFVQYECDDGSTQAKSSRESEYIADLLRTSGIPSIQDFAFLLQYLLIREEEAENTLWNAEDHSKVLRLLFTDGEFEREYTALQQHLKDAHIRFSQHSLLLARSKNELEQLRALEPQNGRDSKIEDREKLVKTLDQLHEEFEGARSRLQAVLVPMGSLRETLATLDNERTTLEERIDSVEEHLHASEVHYHGGLYAQHTPQKMAARKLEEYGMCMFCDRAVSGLIRSVLEEKIKKEEHCLFCGQAWENHSNNEEVPPDSSLYLERKEMRRALSAMERETRSQAAQLSALSQEEGQLRSLLMSLEQRKAELERELILLADITTGTTLSELDRVSAHVQVLEKQTTEARYARDRALVQIAPLRSKAENTLSKLESRFGEIFSVMVQQCLGQDGTVEVQLKQKPGEQAEYAIFRPILGGRMRKSPNEVSKSQAVLLDYAFRMTVLTLYRELTGHSSFFILETFEGVLDVAYVQRIGRLLGDFALDSGHLLVIVNNLSRSDFLNALFGRLSSLSNRLDRTLNFLQYGRLSGVQQEGVQLYERVGHDVFGETFSAV